MALSLALAGCGTGSEGCSDCGTGGSGDGSGTGGTGGTAGSGGTGGAVGIVTGLEVTTAIEGFDRPWDIGWLPNGTVLVTERPGRLNVFVDGIDEPPFVIEPEDLVAVGEGGMLGLEVDPDFEQNGYVFVCFCSDAGGENDVRVVRYTLSTPSGDSVVARNDIVTGMPYSTGRHSGCRPRFGPDDYLWVGTGDAAIGVTPQGDDSLGGKILRVDRDGNAASDNPSGLRWHSKGHRNVQGVAFRQSDGLGMSAEHGPNTDDEINVLVPGNFGWDPVPGYNESVPMTDLEKFPDAIEASFSTGAPTLAYCGAEFVAGSDWADWEGALVVATLKAQHLHLYFVDEDGQSTDGGRWVENRGRLRSPRMGPDGLLYVTTDGSGQTGAVLQVSPVVAD